MRLQRVGRKHEPTFRVVLTDSKNSTRSGKFNEILGSYDPRKDADNLKTDRIKYWLDKGIAVSGSLHNLFVTHKIIDAKKVNVLPKKTPIIKEAPAAETPAPVSEPVTEEKVEETPAEAPEEVAAEPAPEQETVVEAPAETTEEVVSPESETPAENA